MRLTPSHTSSYSLSVPTTPTPRPIRALRWLRLSLHIVQAFLVVGLVYPRVSPLSRARLTQHWSKKLLRILNVSLLVRGVRPAEGTSNLIVVANHVSWLDIFIINAITPASFVAKVEIRDWPLAGWLAEKAGTIFIRRTQRSDTARINREIHDVLASGMTVGLFPEGTTTTGDRLLKFHSSLFQPAVVNHATLCPAALRYFSATGEYCAAATYAGDIGFSDSIKLIIGQRSIICEMIFSPCIGAGGMTRRELATSCEEAIARILDVPIPDAHHRF